MKESAMYKILQEMVVTSNILTAEAKLEMLRLLFEQEDLALYQEGLEQQKGAGDGTI